MCHSITSLVMLYLINRFKFFKHPVRLTQLEFPLFKVPLRILFPTLIAKINIPINFAVNIVHARTVIVLKKAAPSLFIMIYKISKHFISLLNLCNKYTYFLLLFWLPNSLKSSSRKAERKILRYVTEFKTGEKELNSRHVKI